MKHPGQTLSITRIYINTSSIYIGPYGHQPNAKVDEITSFFHPDLVWTYAAAFWHLDARSSVAYYAWHSCQCGELVRRSLRQKPDERQAKQQFRK
jgi:hypothetical protein